MESKISGCLDPEKFKEFKLVKRTELSHNVARFRFVLPKPNSALGVPVVQHVVCRFACFLILNFRNTFCTIFNLHA